MAGDSYGIYYQAHRGAIDERPENTMAAFRHAWRFPGAIPETDVRTTADGVMVCVHDATLARTTDAPEGVRDRPIGDLPLEEVLRWDAGVRFGPEYAGLQVPVLDDLLQDAAQESDRRLFLEPKAVDLGELCAKVDYYGLRERVIFVSGHQEILLELQEIWPGVPAMTWISGSPEAIRRGLGQWREVGPAGVSHLQLHLHVAETSPQIEYALDEAFLLETQAWLNRQGVELQLRPFAVDVPAMRRLLDLGVRWYVTDAPEHFWSTVKAALAAPQERWDASPIYHIAAGRDWEAAQGTGEYRAPSLVEEGFIHCSRREQLVGVANRFYRGQRGLVVLRIDARAIADAVRYEPPAHPENDQDQEVLFPHVYGAVPVSAVTAVVELVTGVDGELVWPADLA